mmetsp:Transcript_8300/g.18545  ORF Transcript_8300/g.18545 Transcript_8300/m.18545 type:complete len:263 (-) Transcript_8300:1671-2459(-)
MARQLRHGVSILHFHQLEAQQQVASMSRARHTTANANPPRLHDAIESALTPPLLAFACTLRRSASLAGGRAGQLGEVETHSAHHALALRSRTKPLLGEHVSLRRRELVLQGGGCIRDRSLKAGALLLADLLEVALLLGLLAGHCGSEALLQLPNGLHHIAALLELLLRGSQGLGRVVHEALRLFSERLGGHLVEDRDFDRFRVEDACRPGAGAHEVYIQLDALLPNWRRASVHHLRLGAEPAALDLHETVRLLLARACELAP